MCIKDYKEQCYNEQNQLNDDRLLTVQDVQGILQFSQNKVYKLFHSEAFPSMKIGGQYRISQKALQWWIDTYRNRKFLLN
jgi:excisionase family DNA binding protein